MSASTTTAALAHDHAAAAGQTMRAHASRLLTADQLAERWQVPKTQVYRLAREGRLPTVTIGRYYRFRLETIEAWELAQEGASDG